MGRGGWEIPAGQKINHNPLSYRWSSVYMALIACLVWIPAGQEMEASNLSFFTNHLLSLPPAPDCSCSNSGLLCLLVASFTCRRHYTHTHANAMFPMDCNHSDAKTQHAPYANRCPLFSVHRKQTGRQRLSSQPVANNPQTMMSPSN